MKYFGAFLVFTITALGCFILIYAGERIYGRMTGQ